MQETCVDPGSGRFPGEGILQYSCLDNSMVFWWAVVHGSAKTQTWLVTYPFSRFLAMKAAAIWEEMRSFASDKGSQLAAGWNHLRGFKKCWLLPPLLWDSDLSEMRIQHWYLTELSWWSEFIAKFANHWHLPYLRYKGLYLDEEIQWFCRSRSVRFWV